MGFEVGQLWDIHGSPSSHPEPPHIEDFLVQRQRFLGRSIDLHSFVLRGGRFPVWKGEPGVCFGGLVDQPDGYYLKESTGVPSFSTGFWIPQERLVVSVDTLGAVRLSYGLTDVRRIRHVGVDSIPEVIEADSVLRVSLARWWNGSSEPKFDEPRCYMQISGLILPPHAAA
ncbi:MAG: hypothetical protein IT335_00510 [Thermomicrobiales bacterium]|nr:hypothetical protein [Thermomicrobiales bacterium]